jgi:hypothetical protein
MTLETILGGAGRLTGRGLDFTGRKLKQGSKWVFDHSYQGWQYAKPVVYGGMGYLATRLIFDQVDPSIDDHILPTVGPYIGPLGRYAVDNFSSIVGTAGGAVAAWKFGKMGRNDARVKLGQPRTNGRNVRGLLGMTVVAPLVIAGIVASWPGWATDLKNRYTASRASVSDVLDKADEGFTPKAVEDSKTDIAAVGGISSARIRADVKTLQELGYNVTEEDMYFTTRVLADEAGNYTNHNDYIKRQKQDLEAISQVVINRYCAAEQSDFFRNNFGRGFKGVVLKKNQFSIANDSENVAAWREAYEKRDLTRNSGGKKHANKIALTYFTLFKTMVDTATNPMSGRPNLFYKNTSISSAIWNNGHFGNYSVKFKEKVGSHWHYELLDKSGQDPVPQYRVDFFGTSAGKRPN